MARTKSAEREALDAWVIRTLAIMPGITAMGLALLRKDGERTKGYYHPVSHSVARLRRQGIIQDVGKRCEHCQRALTRGQKNVPLLLTDYGMSVYLQQNRGLQEAA
jgi:hypothetical protein